MGYKVIALADRQDGVSDAQLRAEQTKHVPMVKAFAADFVTKYRAGFGLPAPDGSGKVADVVAELWVTSFEAFFAGLESPGGQEAVAHANSYLQNLRFLLIEEHDGGWG